MFDILYKNQRKKVMADIQKQLEAFHETIKLKRFEENAVLREKRDIVLKLLAKRLKAFFEEKGLKCPSYTTFDQGSYPMGTGIQPLYLDFDIDEGIIFEISKEDYLDPVEVKKWIYDAMVGHTDNVKMRQPCVTLFYHKDREPIYHLDLAIYAGSNADGKIYLATGKLSSTSERRIWVESDPQSLIDLIRNKFSDSDDAKQFRRVIRYLKRWKDFKFCSKGNAAPTGIVLTIAAYHWFSVCKTIVDPFANKVTYDDLEALQKLLSVTIGKFTQSVVNGKLIERLEVKLPISPYSDLLSGMTDKQMNEFKQQLESLLAAVNEARSTIDLSTACELMNKQFGDDFKVPDKSTVSQCRPRAIVASSASA
jgi:hypothetical protein